MIQQAALYLATDDDVRAARLPVGGRPVAFRAILAALRAGASRVAVPAVLRDPELAAAVAASPSARAAVVWLDGATGLGDGPTLLVPAAAVTAAAGLGALLRSGGGAVLAESIGDGAPVVLADAPLLAGLRAPLAGGAALGDALDRARKARELPAVAGAGWCVRVTGPASAAAAEARLYADLGSPIDTRLDRALHRPLSRHVSRWAVARGLTPNQITAASLVVGLAAAAGLAGATPAAAVAGLALYLAAVVLDHADGEVARLTLTESAAGEWLDIAADTVVHAAIVIAMGLTAHRVAGNGLALGGLAAAGVVASAALVKWQPPVTAAAGVAGLLEGLSSRDGFYAMLLAYVGTLTVRPEALPVLMGFLALACHAYWIARLAALAVTPAPGPGRRS